MLKIEQGAALIFSQDASLWVRDSGRLRVAGVESNPVIFAGAEDMPGYWRGVAFDNSSGADNVLEHLLIENAGSTKWTGDDTWKAALFLDEKAGVSLSHVHITRSGGNGLMVRDGGNWSMKNSRITDNARAAYIVYPNDVGKLDPSNTIGGNSNDRIFVGVSGLQSVQDDQVWHAFDSAYHINAELNVRAALTLSPGVVVEVAQGVPIIVRDGGQFSAKGSASNPVTLTGAEKEPGFWKGIEVRTRSANNVLDHAIIEYAGSGGWYGGSDATAMLHVAEGGKMIVKNTTFRHSGQYAVLVSGDADITGFSGNRFESNARVAYVHANAPGSIASDNVFVGNGEQGVRVTLPGFDRLTTDQTWAALDVPYIIAEHTDVEAHLTIEPGATIAFMQGKNMTFNAGSRLVAEGTDADPITFMGHDSDTAGYWQGLRIRSSAANLISKADILHAGSDRWHSDPTSTAAIFVDGRLTLDDVFIDQSGGNGIYLENSAQFTCTNASFGYLAENEIAGPGTGHCN